MASAWGSSWGSAWGNAWGAIASVVTGGGFSRSKSRKPQIVVVSVDGQDYRVPIEKLSAFLASIKEEIKQTGTVKAKVRKKITAKPPVIIIKSAPVEYKATAQAEVDRSNEILAHIWQGILTRYMQDIEDEDILICLLA